MVGRATLTIVRSTTVMKNATASKAKARQRRTSPGGAGPRSLTSFLRPNMVMGSSRYLLIWTGRRQSAQCCGR